MSPFLFLARFVAPKILRRRSRSKRLAKQGRRPESTFTKLVDSRCVSLATMKKRVIKLPRNDAMKIVKNPPSIFLFTIARKMTNEVTS